MEEITISIRTGNAAFEETPATELARILHQLALRIKDGEFPERLMDINGNCCGRITVKQG